MLFEEDQMIKINEEEDENFYDTRNDQVRPREREEVKAYRGLVIFLVIIVCITMLGIYWSSPEKSKNLINNNDNNELKEENYQEKNEGNSIKEQEK